ncbi:type IV pilus modification protein PilV [Larsenimonas salina]|uniref:type IV pilus modification protein PilV n=1 Tax=Larsenimonas salina TaxID=1295565 RepID=UPI0020746637|nr:type IV pilus modification protein PilV [Larsenimonas salina]MCM5705525.1 type IV pilus modification protein PilV [Larsenimonas salina]
MTHSHATQRGFTLIEVLVTLVIVSIGVMGAVALQLNSLRASDAALSRTRATLLAEGIVERVRANPSAEALAIYNVGESTDPVLGSGARGRVECTASACSAGDWAKRDLWDIDQQLQREGATSMLDGLPEGRACIVVSDQRVTADVVWQGSGGGDVTLTDCGRDVISSGRRAVRIESAVVTP